MSQRFCYKVLLLALLFTFATSNYSDFYPSSTNWHPNSTAESACHCYGKPENDFEYTVCKDNLEGKGYF